MRVVAAVALVFAAWSGIHSGEPNASDMLRAVGRAEEAGAISDALQNLS